MALVFVISAWLGWLAYTAGIQKTAVDAIFRGYGQVAYRSGRHDDAAYRKLPPINFLAMPAPMRPGVLFIAQNWLEKKFGPEFFETVVRVDLNVWNNGDEIDPELMRKIVRMGTLEELHIVNATLTDGTLSLLRDQRRLRVLDLRTCRATAAGMMVLRDLSQIRELSLPNIAASDGLPVLRGLTQLRELTLSGADDIQLANISGIKSLTKLVCHGITDAGLAHLKDLTALRSLDLHYSAKVTSTGLRHLRGMAGLSWLVLDGTRVDDIGPLRHLTGLKMLSLRQTPIGDAGLGPIGSLTALEQLGLDDTKITDAAMAHLRPLSALSYLSMRNTSVGGAGLAHLAGKTNRPWPESRIATSAKFTGPP